MLAVDDVNPYTRAYTLLGVALCMGGLLVLVHSFTQNPKLFHSLRSSFLPKTIERGQPKKTPSEVDYSNVFPPSQRSKLSEANPTAFSKSEQIVDLAKSSEPILGITSDFRTADPSKWVFSGFSVGDVKTLGDFPDYATLSGVPLPVPLKNFNLKETWARPYRPFRWAYHQTMCKSQIFPPCNLI